MVEKEETIKHLNEELENAERKYNEKVEDMRKELEKERTTAKKGLLELAEISKRQEAMFSSSMVEIENFMNKLIEDKKLKTSTKLAQLVLRQVADENSDPEHTS